MRKQQVAQRAKECQIAPNIEELRRKAHEENTQAWEKYLLKQKQIMKNKKKQEDDERKARR
jgi:hypothetical protein